MSEKNYETSELKELKDVLQTFTEFVWEMEEYLPEFYHFLRISFVYDDLTDCIHLHTSDNQPYCNI